MIKNDQRGTTNPYKCINVKKQDAMDDKIIERCKTCEKQCMQEDLDRSRSCRATIEQKPTSMDRTAIKHLSRRQKVPRWIENLSRSYRYCDKESTKRLDRQPTCREVSSSCRDCLKTVFQEEKNIDMNAIKLATQTRIQATF